MSQRNYAVQILSYKPPWVIFLLYPDGTFLKRANSFLENPELHLNYISRDFSSHCEQFCTSQEPIPPDLVAMMMSPFPSLAGARANIFLSVFHSDMRRQSAPLIKTPAKSCSPIPRFSPRIVNLQYQVINLRNSAHQVTHCPHLVPGGPSLGDMPVTIGGGPILLAKKGFTPQDKFCNSMLRHKFHISVGLFSLN